MSDEYQLRKDIDRVYRDIYRIGNDALDVYKIDEINKSIDFIDNKQLFYDDVLAGKIDYFSNIITVEEN